MQRAPVRYELGTAPGPVEPLVEEAECAGFRPKRANLGHERRGVGGGMRHSTTEGNGNKRCVEAHRFYGSLEFACIYNRFKLLACGRTWGAPYPRVPALPDPPW